MLVMRRRAGERFLIGESIEIEVLEVSGSRVKLGIVAPASVPILRKEARTTREENVMAAGGIAHRDIIVLARRLASAKAGVGIAAARFHGPANPLSKNIPHNKD